ncbi:MAG: hypothetical protein DHS80DRAFT_28467 [Piptocephalis tieghemiana]|nr:MAG: hypothetical protein DHS80DRAFT_28467 [Piptocephalis tieghemiana]
MLTRLTLLARPLQGVWSRMAMPSRSYATTSPAATIPSFARPIRRRNTARALPARKALFYEEYKAFIRDSQRPFLLAQHSNLTTAESLLLRRELGAVGAYMRVIRPAMIRAAARELNSQKDLIPLLHGPMCIIQWDAPLSSSSSSSDFPMPPPLNPAQVKATMEILSNHHKILLLAGKMEGQLIAGSSLQDFSNLPSLPTLQSQLLGTLSSIGGQGLLSLLSRAGGQEISLLLEQYQKDRSGDNTK